MPLPQRNRSLRILTPLGTDVLLLRRMTGAEGLSHLFEFELDLLSDRLDIAPEEILGQSVSMSIRLPSGKLRYINGVVSQFYRGPMDSPDIRAYRATVRPWLWFLTQTSDSRIFQEINVPDIIAAVLDERGFSEYELRLIEDYELREYCVQYQETDFNFLSRLMEEEGIYYFFEHVRGKHKLVLCDSPTAHSTTAEYEKVTYSTPRDDRHESVYSWVVRQAFFPGAYTVNDYSFLTPQTSLLASSDAGGSLPQNQDYEMYEYPGGYQEQSVGQAFANRRMQGLKAGFELAQGMSTARGLASGAVFTLIGHAVSSENNRSYLLVSLRHNVEEPFKSPDPEASFSYSCAFTAVPSKVHYRPPRVTPKAIIRGPQTGVVVGPVGEEIYADQYGRIKVQFHWDRLGNSDERSSCWMRVAQIWAGKGWGSLHIPRVGHEVLVEFLEGEPRRPVVVGCLYNEENQPPYALPDNLTQSGFKSRSSIGNREDHFNEIRFDDKQGQEEFYIHAEKDQNIEVGYDKSEWIGNNATIEVGKDRTESIGSHETRYVGEDRSDTVGKNETRSIGAIYSLTVGQHESRLIGGDRSTSVGQGESVTVGKHFTLEAGEAITLRTGQASLKMNSDGTIEIRGTNLMVDASGTAQVNGAAGLQLRTGAQALLRGANARIEGSSLVTIKGGVVRIN